MIVTITWKSINYIKLENTVTEVNCYKLNFSIQTIFKGKFRYYFICIYYSRWKWIINTNEMQAYMR